LQTLSRSGLLESIRGPRGGYRLGRPRRDIHLDDVMRIAVSEDGTPEDGPAGELQDKVVGHLWTELERKLAEQLHGITVDDLVKRAEAAGMVRPLAEPISFSI
jgi:Rrf2 family protein